MKEGSKSGSAKIVILLLFAVSAGIFVYGYGSHDPWMDFGFRMWNLFLFVSVIIYAAGGKMRAFFKSRTEGIRNEINSLEKAKEDAAKSLKSVEQRIRDLDKERDAILADYAAQGEAVKADIIMKANKSAEQIITQAELVAQNEVSRAVESIRGELAEEIIAATETLLKERLDRSAHEQLINKSLSKVVLN